MSLGDFAGRPTRQKLFVSEMNFNAGIRQASFTLFASGNAVAAAVPAEFFSYAITFESEKPKAPTKGTLTLGDL